ncbi:hypothetical protein AYI70_g7210 [Smittium culicis]|uniref:Uncharacterized protein n=1 Tax=Smittium culicis TaxID=133412 RepID=A0A1R1XLN8_9FUNG|nr:hypothetical protein AYI70_g7210 [Smittium culicis]
MKIKDLFHNENPKKPSALTPLPTRKKKTKKVMKKIKIKFKGKEKENNLERVGIEPTASDPPAQAMARSPNSVSSKEVTYPGLSHGSS